MISNDRLDVIAAHLVGLWTDPTNPINHLKRKAKRTCIVCNEPFTSILSMLCAGALTCSDACEKELTNA